MSKENPSSEYDVNELIKLSKDWKSEWRPVSRNEMSVILRAYYE
jgi:hypothetical protein